MEWAVLWGCCKGLGHRGALTVAITLALICPLCPAWVYGARGAVGTGQMAHLLVGIGL